ncbi:prolyl oligopeptidase family serine peptidase [Glaciecola sp. 1036]|uniref:prolyl oligopeptidase family serine peptidase n=1 Tax=Alteromonadaceae TaxID=72275 RepID=UPI003CFEECBD
MTKHLLALCIISTLAACSEKPEDVKEVVQRETLAEPQEPAPLWLEEVEGEKALQTVNNWNAKTLSKLTSDERFSELQNEALEIVNATDKVAYGNMQGDYVYNFWQGENSKRGILRRTSLESYQTASPNWETVLDIDALNEKEDKNWVYKGSTCLEPEYIRCLVSLSNGGKDAVEIREFDRDQKAFVKNGFFIPEAKSDVSWIDINTITVGTDWGDNSLTESGYPSVSKVLERGSALSDAKTIFSGEITDVAAGASLFEIDDETDILIGYQYSSFYDSEFFWLKGSEQIKLPIPSKATPAGVFKGQMLVDLKQDWKINEDLTLPLGALVSFDMKKWLEDQSVQNAQIVYQPTERATLSGSSIAKSKVIVTALENVVGKVYAMDFVDGKWQKEQLSIPGTGTLSVSSVSDSSDTIFVNQNTFIKPNQQLIVDVVENTSKVIKSAPERFDSSDLVVDQKMAESTDGTMIPYFIIHHKDIPLDGTSPTLLYAYGGFEVSLTPSYSGTRGKLWLENGGVYVLANIRGGGEFGPKWHQAGLKTKRQTIYDDMISVAQDLIDTKVTSTQRLGIMGGSNGGLLMGVMYTQRPDLFNAVVCQVPLLDMLRYHKLLAGASWVGEYGSPEIPEERAFLETISPLHNVNEEGEYPTIFFVTSTKDDRVHPGHARKMAYLLEQYGHSFEYYENIDGGHAAGADLNETAKRIALEYTFLMQKLMD